MGSLFEELEAREAAARVRVEELEEELALVTMQLGQAREGLERLRVTRETVAEVLAEMTVASEAETEVETPDGGQVSSPYAGAERRVVGVLAVPKWQPGMDVKVLPQVYQDICAGREDRGHALEAEAPRRAGLARRGRTGAVHPGPRPGGNLAQLRVEAGLFSLQSKVPPNRPSTRRAPGWNRMPLTRALTCLPARSVPSNR
ncbi:hypothetical protein [Streptomyces sp. NPDC059994]|uniref:hypothetical protein n=1 Tax=Streptomyces sp. NPDC059994 TaxID=3347029 RepID=UPI00367E2032